METVNDIRHALSARSRTATLEQLASEGRKRVRLIKAEHVAAMIAAAVHAAVDESGVVSKEEADKLVERSRDEFQQLMKDRQAELQRLQELETLVAARDQELAELRTQLQQRGGAPAAGTTTAAAAPELSAALEKLAGSLNDRLEKLGKKMGISAAIEGAEVNFDGLFKDTGKTLESNMENIQVKQKAGGGIAANLERLKKLKGGS